jgi:uncharacterized Zn finger protein (UPF0148 family)
MLGQTKKNGDIFCAMPPASLTLRKKEEEEEEEERKEKEGALIWTKIR